MFQSALICTDFSDGLYRLVNVVPSLVAGGLQRIIFFHNAPLLTELEIPRVDEERAEKARQALSVACEGLPEGIEVKVEVASGRASDSILKAAEQYQVDVVFMGMPTRTLLTEKLFGSTTMGLTQRTHAPLMILRPQLMSAFTTAELKLRCESLFEYLLLPYDGSDGAETLVNKIRQGIQGNPDSELKRCLLCWVVDDSQRRGMMAPHPVEAAQTKLDKVKADLESLGLEVKTVVVEGSPQEELLKVAEANDISAIAVCARRASGIMRWSVPSFTSDLLRSSWHPVIYFPPD
jgi:nucleotide-binding universal stress UspA family protein